MPTVHNDVIYRENIRNYLIERAHAVQVDKKGNLMNLAVLGEDFYVEFLNILLNLKLENANASKQNMAGIDLVDWENRVAMQVSATCAPQSIRKKIQKSIDKYDMPIGGSWQFYFVPIKDEAPTLTKDFRIPEGLTFNIQKDVLDISQIMNLAKGIEKLRKLSELVDKYGKATQQTVPRYIHCAQLKEPIHYLVPSEIHEAGKDRLANLLVEHVSWIVGEHGMGKTTFMHYLINKEIENPATGKSIVWVNYSEDLVNSLGCSLERSGLTIKDIDQKDYIVFIDNAVESIIQELNGFKFRSVVSTCSFSGNATVRLGTNPFLAKRIIENNLVEYKISPTDESLNAIVKKANGHPYVARLLSIQAKQCLDDNIPLSQYNRMLQKEGFNLVGKYDVKSVAERIAERFKKDYAVLDSEATEILKCFSLLDGYDFYIYPEAINWKTEKLHKFAELHKKGFLERDGENGYYMHEIMRHAVKHLCGRIRYADVKELVIAFGSYIERDNLHGANMISVYNEVMLAFALFTSLSGNNFWEKNTVEPFEYEPEYAWMAHNIFSAFDDFKNDLAHDGSKYAAKLCELSYREKGLPGFKLATSFNSVGYLPAAYKDGISIPQTLELISENFDYLYKARAIIMELKARGEEHEQFEAKISSNIGATWQRVLRIFISSRKATEDYAQTLEYVNAHCTDDSKVGEIWKSINETLDSAPYDPERYEKVVAHIRSCEKKAYLQAYDIRLRMYKQYENEDEEKQLRRRNLAKTTFVLATKEFYDYNYQEAIRLHEIAIDMFKKLEAAGVNVNMDLFVSYSRCANTHYHLAEKGHSFEALLDAVYSFSIAYDYLNKLVGSNKRREIAFYEDFLHAAIDLRNCKPKYRMFFDGMDSEIDTVISAIRAQDKKAIDSSGMDEKAKGKKLKELDLITNQGKDAIYFNVH